MSRLNGNGAGCAGFNVFCRQHEAWSSPNPEFVRAAFGKNIEEFYEILSMPDHYIVYRDHYKDNGACEWRRELRRLSEPERDEFLNLLERLNRDRRRKHTISGMKRYRSLLEHYYPKGESPPRILEGRSS